jgi:tetratricopeptide (TPR) repeat protein
MVIVRQRALFEDIVTQPTVERGARRAQALQALQQGVALHRVGRIDEAESHYRQALRLAPDNPSAIHLLGVVALNRGDLKRAAEMIRQALRLRPDFADAHLNLGNVLLDSGQRREAVESYRRAIALTPGKAMAHRNLGRALNELGECEAAVGSARTAIQLEPAMAAGHLNLAAALAKANRFAEAETAYLRAAMLEPGNAEVHRDLGIVLTELNRLDEALVCLDRALALKPHGAAVHQARGRTLAAKNDFTGAEVSFRRAAELDPSSSDSWIGLAWALRMLGRFAEADACFERVRTLDPSRMEAYRHLATPGPASSDAEQISRLAAQLEQTNKPARDRALAGFALGRLLDSADRFDEAFERYRAANALVRKANDADGIRFDFSAFRQRADLLIERYQAGRFGDPVAGSNSELPVFIVGMIRSGTTLTEQIAASHSRIFGAGELQDIGRIANELAGVVAGKRQVTARQADAELAARLAHRHLLRLRQLGGDGAVRVIDKMPDNVLHLGLIAQLYPRARVILCTRDARDVALSCYFQLFAEGLHPFSYDLADCGRRTAEVNRLIAHWRRTLPLRWHEVNYETLVGDLEGESRRLLAFLGVPWEPGCLEFHRTERTVTTMSQWQVRQPIYDRSVGRWRHYQSRLGPLFEALESVDSRG